MDVEEASRHTGDLAAGWSCPSPKQCHSGPGMPGVRNAHWWLAPVIRTCLKTNSVGLSGQLYSTKAVGFISHLIKIFYDWQIPDFPQWHSLNALLYFVIVELQQILVFIKAISSHLHTRLLNSWTTLNQCRQFVNTLQSDVLRIRSHWSNLGLITTHFERFSWH